MSVRVACPGCGGAVVFNVGTAMVAICPHCRSAVARGDRSVENLGKVAELVDTGAVLRVGLNGKYEGEKFQLMGRAQIGHAAGGIWDEWYAAFPNGKWGWLSEAQGRFQILFEQDAPEAIPAFDDLRIGHREQLPEPHNRFVVAETGSGKFLGAEGDIPFRFTPGATYPYADLSGPGKTFGTIDYGDDPPALYAGREVTLDDLGIPESERREIHELKQIAGEKIGCPQCGGALELKAPDRTERVGCPYCGSLLDCKQGKLKLLQALSEPAFQLVLPIGSVGHFGDEERTVIGALLRSVTVAGTDYFWQEYILYHPRDGFEWLVWAENHWTRLKSVSAGDVDVFSGTARYNEMTFKKFRTATATVRGVVGECYWKVSVNEEAHGAEYINPPLLLTREGQISGPTREVNWNVGEYLTPAEVQAAFSLPQALPSPKGVAPNQPFRYKAIYKIGGIAIAALIMLGLFMTAIKPKNLIYERGFILNPSASTVIGTPVAVPGKAATPAPTSDKTQIFFTDLFDLRARQNICITVSVPTLLGWLVVEGDLVEQSSGQIQPFIVPLAYHAGVEDGENWTEGDRTNYTYVSAQPPGQYSLRLEVERENPSLSGMLNLRVEQGVARRKMWILTLLGIALVPIIVAICHLVFNARRWSESDTASSDSE